MNSFFFQNSFYGKCSSFLSKSSTLSNLPLFSPKKPKISSISPSIFSNLSVLSERKPTLFFLSPSIFSNLCLFSEKKRRKISFFSSSILPLFCLFHEKKLGSIERNQFFVSLPSKIESLEKRHHYSLFFPSKIESIEKKCDSSLFFPSKIGSIEKRYHSSISLPSKLRSLEKRYDSSLFFPSKIGSFSQNRNFSKKTSISYSFRKMIQNGDSYGGQGLHVKPSSDHKYTLIFMHGLGDTAHGWSSIVEELKTLNSHMSTKYIFPTANVRPITLNGGLPQTGWADIYGLSADTPEDKKGYDESLKRISSIIDQEISVNHILPQNIIIGGFSQGGALAYLVGLSSKYRLASIISLSSWVPLKQFLSVSDPCLGINGEEKVEGTPVFHCHGDQDNLVLYQFGKICTDSLRSTYNSKNEKNEQNPNLIQFHLYKGMGHSSCTKEINDIRQYIQSIFK